MPDEVLLLVRAHSAEQHPFVRSRQLNQPRHLPELLACTDRAEIALEFPSFEVGRRIKPDLAPFGKYDCHDPSLSLDIPKHIWIAERSALDVQHGIAGVVIEV